MNANKKIKQGATWSFVEKIGQQGFSFVIFLLLAKIIGPEAYGLANFCFIYALLAYYLMMALADGIVPKQVTNEKQLSTLFWMICGIGACLSLICYITAGLVADLFHEPSIKELLHLFSVVPFLIGLTAIPHTIFLRDMNFKIHAIQSLTAAFVAGIFALWLAFEGWGAYAVVVQQIILYGVMNIILWFSTPWRPKGFFEFSQTMPIVRSGLNMLWVNMITFWDVQIPRIFIGAILNSAALGYYSFATRLQFAVQEMLIHAPSAVFYTHLAGQKQDFEKSHLLIVQTIFLFSLCLFPLLTLAIMLAPDYIFLLFGTEWQKAVFPLQCYLITLYPMVLIVLTREIFRAYNHLQNFIKYHFWINFFKLGCIPTLWLPSGLESFSIAFAGYSCISVIIYGYLLQKKYHITFQDFKNALLEPLLLSSVIAGILLLWKNIFAFENHWINFISLSLVSLTVIGGWIVYRHADKLRGK